MSKGKLTIAIDGPAASGKGTLARSLAARLDLTYLDTGTLYRASAREVLNAGGNPEQEEDAIQGAQALIEALANSLEPLAHPDLRLDHVGIAASHLAAIQSVRDILIQFQKDFAAQPPGNKNGAILDGRDIGTVICPDADVKLFVTASDEVRALRRQKELQSQGIQVTYSTVLADMRKRDARDAHTLDAHQAPGYKTEVLDTSALTAEDALAAALAVIQAKTGLQV